MKYSKIILYGEEIKQVASNKKVGIIYLPKELVGRFVKICLLTEEQEEELNKKVKQAEQFKESLIVRNKNLIRTQLKLKELRDFRKRNYKVEEEK